MKRCQWGNISEKMISYHDKEWGIPVHDDRLHFEYLLMEVMQCGLSWNLMIEKRDIFRDCFNNFNFKEIAKYTDTDIKRILEYEGMIHSESKIRAVINNASCFLKIIEEYGSFDKFIWGYSNGKTILYQGHQKGIVPAKNGLSVNISKELKKRGFKYLGPVVIYSHLQACGVICDHTEECFNYKYIVENYPIVKKRRDSEDI